MRHVEVSIESKTTAAQSRAGRVASRVLATVFALAASLFFSQAVQAQANTVELLAGTLQSGNSRETVEFTPATDGDHTIRTGWENTGGVDANIRFSVFELNANGTRGARLHTSTSGTTSPKTWTAALDSGQVYLLAAWIVGGVGSADYSVELITYGVQDAGEASSTLELDNISIDLNNWIFSVTVTDGNGNVAVSDGATLMVNSTAGPGGETLVVDKGTGRLDTSRASGPRQRGAEFTPLVSGEHTIELSWNNTTSADLRFRVVDGNGNRLSEFSPGQSPIQLTFNLIAGVDYRAFMRAFDGAADYELTVTPRLRH